MINGSVESKWTCRGDGIEAYKCEKTRRRAFDYAVEAVRSEPTISAKSAIISMPARIVFRDLASWNLPILRVVFETADDNNVAEDK